MSNPKKALPDPEKGTAPPPNNSWKPAPWVFVPPPTGYANNVEHHVLNSRYCDRKPKWGKCEICSANPSQRNIAMMTVFTKCELCGYYSEKEDYFGREGKYGCGICGLTRPWREVWVHYDL